MPPVLCLCLVCLVAAPTPLHAVPSATVLITGVYFDPFVPGEDSEAIQLQNITAHSVSLADWQLSDGQDTVKFPAGTGLNAGQKIWATKSAAAFQGEFGFSPDFEYGADSDSNVPNLTGSAFSLANAGDRVLLLDGAHAVVDAMAYGNASLGSPDWTGSAVERYFFPSASIEGQILVRKRQEANGMPVTDTGTRADWAQDTADNVMGKQVEYPGWDRDEFFQTVKSNSPATVKYCVAPDNLFECVRGEILSATSSISMEMYSVGNANLVEVITGTIDAGVRVSLLLDGGALDDPGKWACLQIEAHGGQCWIFSSKPQANVHKRYDSQHGKWAVIDHARVLIGSENLADDAMPSDDKSNGTLGARGGFMVTDNAEIVDAAQHIMDRDFDPQNHADVRRWGTNTDDFPPLDFAPNYTNGGKGYPVRFATPLVLNGALPIELLQCPDNCLRTNDALLGLAAKAGPGDTLLIEQLYE